MSNSVANPTGISSGYIDTTLGHNEHVLHVGINRNTGTKISNLGSGKQSLFLDSGKLIGSSTATAFASKHTTTTMEHSFASFFKDNGVPSEASLLHYIAPTVGEVVIGCDEIDSVEDTHGYCLVGYVMGPRPSPFAVLNFIKGWGGNTKFFFMENGWIKFQFATESDRDGVLNGGTYMIMGRQLFLKVMPSCFLFRKEDMEFIPTWIQIYGLPKQCWTAPALSKVASVVGKPLHTDALTISKRGATYARVLVEMDVKKPRVWEYSIKLPTGKSTLAKFKYESDPKYCDECNSLGHTTETCGVENMYNSRMKRSTYCPNQQVRDTAKDKEKVTNVGDINSDTHWAEPEASGTKTNEAPAATATEQPHGLYNRDSLWTKSEASGTKNTEAQAETTTEQPRLKMKKKKQKKNMQVMR